MPGLPPLHGGSLPSGGPGGFPPMPLGGLGAPGLPQGQPNLLLASLGATQVGGAMSSGASPSAGGLPVPPPAPGSLMPGGGGMQFGMPLGAQGVNAASNSTLTELLGRSGPDSGGGARAEQSRTAQEAAARASRNEAAQAAAHRERREEVEKVKCHLHKKIKNGCKFCQKYQAAVAENEKKDEASKARSHDPRTGRRRLDRAISEDPDRQSGPLEVANPKTYGLSGLLQTHIVECAHYKSLLTLESFEQVVDETYQFANSVEPYMANSGTVPSALFCCLYRFFSLGLDGRQLRRLLDHPESPYIRCCGFLYVRLALPHDQLLHWLGEYLLDDEEFKLSPDSDLRTTVGEFVEGLLAQDRYFNTVLPRLPMVTKRHVEERLAPVGQYRKRLVANKEIVHVFRDQGTRVEANISGEWLGGSIIELEEDVLTRPKVRVRMDDGSEEYVNLGKVILLDGGRGPRARSRSRGRRTGSPRTDWSRTKGRKDSELIDEMRSREREKAVCSSGKEYARKPLGYKAACALPREQGAASYRLMEEETFVPMSRQKRTRTPSPERETAGRRPSAEHQARMQQLFEKYGNVKGPGAEDRRSDEVDRPDVMRLG